MILRDRNASGRYSSKAVSASGWLRDIASNSCHHARHFVGRCFRTFHYSDATRDQLLFSMETGWRTVGTVLVVAMTGLTHFDLR